MKKALNVTIFGEIRELDMTGDPLKTLQDGVAGLVEAIDLSYDLTMWVNEEGKNIELPHNPFAQTLWDEAFGEGSDYIFGDVMFTGGTDQYGNTKGITIKKEQHVREKIHGVFNAIFSQLIHTQN